MFQTNQIPGDKQEMKISSYQLWMIKSNFLFFFLSRKVLKEIKYEEKRKIIKNLKETQGYRAEEREAIKGLSRGRNNLNKTKRVVASNQERRTSIFWQKVIQNAYDSQECFTRRIQNVIQEIGHFNNGPHIKHVQDYFSLFPYISSSKVSMSQRIQSDNQNLNHVSQ